MAFVKPIQLNMQFWILLMLYRPISTDVYFHVESLLTWKKLLIPVGHSILLSKLNFYGFRGIINNWFSSYLRNKLQIGQHVSDKVEINYGVPQGSILGPLLFLLCINDIQNCSNSYTNILYADKNLRVLEQTVTLTLNIKKSNSPLSKETYYW